MYSSEISKIHTLMFAMNSVPDICNPAFFVHFADYDLKIKLILAYVQRFNSCLITWPFAGGTQCETPAATRNYASKFDLWFKFWSVALLTLSVTHCDDVDIDDCATNNGGCSAQANCTNTEGNIICTCLPGFTGDGFTCTGKWKHLLIRLRYYYVTILSGPSHKKLQKSTMASYNAVSTIYGRSWWWGDLWQ